MTNKEKIEFIEFNKEILPQLLDLFNCEIDDEGRIIDKIIKEPIKDSFSLRPLKGG